MRSSLHIGCFVEDLVAVLFVAKCECVFYGVFLMIKNDRSGEVLRFCTFHFRENVNLDCLGKLHYQ